VTSIRKVEANRANARASTGPTTARGRARTARNALQHGLSVPAFSHPMFSEEVDALAREIAGSCADAKIQELVRRVAEAEIDLGRARDARHQLLNRALRDPNSASDARVREKNAPVLRGRRVEDPFTPMPQDVVKFPGPLKLANILSDEAARRLLVIDRYERRALSRRKVAIRAYDESCRDVYETT
jgi:hypothetical protein